ncbi:u5 snrnp-specific protein, partial [Cystoisospora suis]
MSSSSSSSLVAAGGVPSGGLLSRGQGDGLLATPSMLKIIAGPEAPGASTDLAMATQRQSVLDYFQSGRKSGLEAPTMRLTGHSGEVLAVGFSPDGRNIASAGVDREVLIYHVYGEIFTWRVLKGHTKAILDFRWSIDGSHILTASADETACIWDVETGERLKKLKGHVGIINACSMASREACESPNRATYGCASLLVTGSDDGTSRVWDTRIKKCIKKYQHHYQILSVALDGHGGRVFAGSLDSTIR